jgi:pimeloyl-ACP methyl ester carboxylesterase
MKDWLLLRGWGREQRHWEKFPGVLGQALGARKVACLDLPGVGTEHRETSPWSISEITDRLRRRWLKKSGGEPAGLVAISLGGMVALDWTARYPADFERLVLINSSVAGVSPPWRRLNLKMLPEIFRIATARDLAARESRILGMTTEFLPTADEVALRWAGYAKERPVRLATLAKQLLAATRFRLEKKPSCPTLVISSDGDKLVGPSCSRALAEHLGAALVRHPSAGHDVPLENPEWTASAIGEWLRQ